MTKRQQTLILIFSMFFSLTATSWGQSPAKTSLLVSATVLPASSFTVSPIITDHQQTKSPLDHGTTLSVKCTSETRLTIQLASQRPHNVVCSGSEQSIVLSSDGTQPPSAVRTLTITY